MLETSTNALIACLRALSNESRRTERRLNDDRISDGDSAELGHYMTDLQEALAVLNVVQLLPGDVEQRDRS